MTQLDLTALQLFDLGFRPKIGEKVTYQLPTINGAFVFNPLEKEYRWYHMTIIGEASNWVHLNIPDIETLKTLIAAFKAIKTVTNE